MSSATNSTTEPDITTYPLAGTDDRLVRVKHKDGHFIVFRICADLTVGQFTTWDVSGEYADAGHVSCEDRAAAKSFMAAR